MTSQFRYSLLIVEDDDLNLEWLKGLFKRDYDVLTFSNPQEALKHVKEQKPRIDLILSDQQMPGMSGLEFLQKLAESYPKAVKIILTGHAKTNDLLEALNKTLVYRYMTKPVDPVYLQSEVTEALKKYESQLQQVNLNDIGDAIMVVDGQGIIVSLNAAAEQLLGYLHAEVEGKDFKQILQGTNPHEQSQLLDFLNEAKNKTYPVLRESMGMRKDGTTIPLDLSITERASERNNVFVISARNAQKRKLSEERSRYQASHDELTGLPNRRLFIERLEAALHHASNQRERLAVISINLDRFQVINNTLGYTGGNQVLEKVAEMLIRCTHEGDTVSRFAADEFAVLLMDIHGTEEVGRFAQRVLRMINTPFTIEKHELYLACSMGISFYPTDGKDPESLLTKANTAMAAAKKRRGNTYQLFNPVLNMEALDRLAFESGLRKGIERNEFLLYYQPIVHAGTLEVVGAEALIRWKHPKLGLISPSEFIPVAEETGIISSIGEWALRTACQQNKLWQEKEERRFPVMVNVSTSQFREERFTSAVKQALRETRLDPAYLELEVTESLMMENVDSTIKKLQDLKDIGILLCIDDFGTGYSSFSYLKQFPIDVLKIDRSFVRDLATNTKDAAIASAIIDIAHRLKLEVVAEGVETKEQMAFLRTQACDKLQGFLFSPPMPIEMFSTHDTASWQKLLRT